MKATRTQRLLRTWEKIGRLSVLTFTCGWMMGCSSSVPAIAPESSSSPAIAPSSSEQVAALGQSLPISAQIKVADQLIQLEVARTPDEQSMGLMYRPKLEANRGMLFPFNPPRQVGFWMKNVLIDLDMVFLKDGKVVAIAANVPPCKTAQCPVYGPSVPIDQVIELAGGRAQELGIKVGDPLVVKNL